MIKATARVVLAPGGAAVRFNFLVLDGEHQGGRWAVPRDQEYRVSRLGLGSEVPVKFTPDDQFAYLDL